MNAYDAERRARMRRADATRSFRKAMEQTGPARREAVREHFARYVPPTPQAFAGRQF